MRRITADLIFHLAVLLLSLSGQLCRFKHGSDRRNALLSLVWDSVMVWVYSLCGRPVGTFRTTGCVRTRALASCATTLTCTSWSLTHMGSTTLEPPVLKAAHVRTAPATATDTLVFCVCNIDSKVTVCLVTWASSHRVMLNELVLQSVRQSMVTICLGFNYKLYKQQKEMNEFQGVLM